MRKQRLTIIVLTTLVMLVTATYANAQSAIPHRFQPARDAGLVTKINPIDGRTWSTWTYRQGAETDIAISSRNSDGVWSEPTLLGAYDGIEQAQPTMVIDHNGNVYVAWAEPNTGRVMVTAHGFSDGYWSTPKPVNDVRVQGSSPALMVAAQRRLVVAFVADGAIRFVELRLLPKRVPTQMSDGPDPVGDGTDDDDDTPDGGTDDDPNDDFDNDDIPTELGQSGGTRGHRRQF